MSLLQGESPSICSLISASCGISALRRGSNPRQRPSVAINPPFVPKAPRPPALSHHLSPRHGVLLVSRVPGSKVVHVSSRVHRRPFGGHVDVPQRARGGGGHGWGGQVVSFKSTGPVLHDLLVFGPFVLEPYFHLKEKERERVNSQVVMYDLVLGQGRCYMRRKKYGFAKMF